MKVLVPEHVGGKENYAVTKTDQPGVCTITWEKDGQPEGECDGYIAGDSTLFAPSDGTMPVGTFVDEDGELSEYGHWYEVETGADAILICGKPVLTVCDVPVVHG